MIPRVPSFTSLKSGNYVTAKRATTAINAFAFDVGHFIQQEAVVEGVLHVSAAQAHSCMERFEDLDHFIAPDLPALHTVLSTSSASFTIGSRAAGSTPLGIAALQSASSGERVIQEAFCLATPPDNPNEVNKPLRQPHSTLGIPRPSQSFSAGSSGSSSSSMAGRIISGTTEPGVGVTRRAPGRVPSNSNPARVAEANTGPVEQSTACPHAYAAAAGVDIEVLQASEAVARTRRRKLLSLLRTTREARDKLVKQLQSSKALQALASLGDIFVAVEVCDEEECVVVDLSGTPATSSTTLDSMESEHEYLDWIANNDVVLGHNCSTCAVPCTMRAFVQ